jgi:hypothetical protein
MGSLEGNDIVDNRSSDPQLFQDRCDDGPSTLSIVVGLSG